MDKTTELFELARRELLDLSQKNSLINFKPRKAYGVFFSNPNAGEFFEHLVNMQKPVSFTTGETTNVAKVHIDLDDATLKSKLTKTYRQAKSFIEEKGINTLFLAVGFVKSLDERNELNAPLILIPAELKKKENSEAFTLSYSTEEIRENITILTKLKNEYNLDLTYNEEDITSLDKYFRYIIKILDGNTSIKLDTEECALDFFSFTKLLMFKDLEIDSWTDKNGKITNKICEQLFITDFSDKEDKTEKEINPITICNVLDSDSSQSEAIYDVINGKNLVLQGPPGTGKSQTITNIIASSVANGKSVLFVSEKMAALDVVKRRLESVGLGDLVLELHSHKTNKKRILKSLEQTLHLGEPKTLSNSVLYEKYKVSSDELNDYIQKLNIDIKSSGFTLSEIYARALEIEETVQSNNIKLPKIEISGLTRFTKQDYNQRLSLLEEFVGVVSSIGAVEKHPLYGVELEACMPFEQIAIKDRLVAIEDTLNTLIKVSNDVMNFFGVRNCSSVSDTKRILTSLKFLRDTKDLGGLNPKNDLFATSEGIKKINDYINMSKSLQKDYNNEKLFKKEVYLERRYNDYVNDYINKANKEAEGKITEGFAVPAKFKKNLKILKNHFDLYNEFIDDEKVVENIFGDFYTGAYTTNWAGVETYINIIANMQKMISNNEILSQTKLADFENKFKINELITNLEEGLDMFHKELDKFFEQTEYNNYKKYEYATWYNDYAFTDVRKIINQMKNHIGDIDKIASYNGVVYKLKKLGLTDVVKLIGKFKYDYKYLVSLFSFTYFDYLINYAYEVYPELNEFKKYKATRLVEVFKELDIKIMVENIKQILVKHWEQMPKLNDQSKDMSIIRRELQKKRNHMAVRKLISRSSESILKIKPVFMMSPLSIAQYLAPNEVVFDLVVFDEASQVKPVEAFGALLRAKQIVVVGDSKQLPPTSFFDRLTNKFDEVNDEDYDVSSMESILSLLLAKNVRERTLEWHYRSRHQSLISYSNKAFYDDKLKTFPSVFESDDNLGLVFKHSNDTAYDRGKSSSNPLEAKQVIEYAIEQAKENPHLSMGIASFSISQQEALLKEFERQIKNINDPEVRRYFSSDNEDPFFIKNLENVQGDERDIILISIGYGYDANRKLTMDFGPINKNDGERRLNVLITRAKEKCVVFSNIRGSDINLSKTNSSGVEALKNFLQYAELRGNLNSNIEDEDDSLFVEILNDKLKQYGYTTDLEVGKPVGIDIAIFDKEMNRFVCGVETDFGAYKNIKSTTDRERIRHNVLKSLGWKVYHIWSNDYYRNSRVELENIFNFIDASKSQTKEDANQKKVELNFVRKNTEEVKLEEFTKDYRKHLGQKRRSAVLSDNEGLIKLIESIVSTESPIHTAVLKKRLTEVTNKDQWTETETNCFIDCLSKTKFVYEGDFLIKPNAKVWIRNRKDADLTIRKIDHLHNLELGQAIKYTIDRGLAATIEEIIREVINLLGFNRNQRLIERIKTLVSELEVNNEIYLDDGIYFLEGTLISDVEDVVETDDTEELVENE
ncbi:MAG: DUF4011 domain-containing protein [bacterium]